MVLNTSALAGWWRIEPWTAIVIEMSVARAIVSGAFGRVALLDMTRSLVGHAHAGCHALFKVGGGDAGFSVGGAWAPLTDASVVLVNAWQAHAYVHGRSSKTTRILALYLDPAWLALNDRRLMRAGAAGFFDRPAVEASRRLQTYADRLAERVDAQSVGVAPDIFSLMTTLCDACVDQRRWGERATNPVADPVIRRALRCLRARLDEPLDADATARSLGLSRPQFFKRFHDATGLAPGMVLSTLRMECACQALARRDQSVAEIGLDLGFSAQPNFTRFFRAHQGVPPGAYRRAIANV